MLEVEKTKNSGEAYRKEIQEILELTNKDIESFVKMFRSYVTDLQTLDDAAIISKIRKLLKEHKLEVREKFPNCIFGWSGCFPQSVRVLYLASLLGFDLRLARSSKLVSILHVLLIEADSGRCYEVTEAQKHNPILLSLKEIKKYASIIQKVLNRFAKLKKPLLNIRNKNE